MPLTDVKVRAAKPQEKAYKLFDERGLYLLIETTGAKLWRLKYRYGPRKNGKPGKAEKTLSLGSYPDVPLTRAREKRDDARRTLADGVDPSAQRQAEKHAAADSFEAVAREWFAKFSPGWTEDHTQRTTRRFEKHLLPWLGSKPIGAIKAPDLLMCLRRIEGSGSVDTAHRAREQSGQVFRYAIATGRAERDPSADLRGALAPVVVKHHASITDPTQIGPLLRALDGYSGSFPVRCALRLAPLLFVRPGELRYARWSEFDLEGKTKEWRIPAERMKMREQHIVPLSKQAVAILLELKPLTGADGGFLFPALRDRARPMSENTVNAALRTLGYAGDQMTGHGFRSMASTLLNEQGWNKDAIERQLAHGERDQVRAAYNYAEHLPERRKMMQAWSDYLDGLKAGGKIVPIRRQAGR